jgi:hypothetical protein
LSPGPGSYLNLSWSAPFIGMRQERRSPRIRKGDLDGTIQACPRGLGGGWGSHIERACASPRGSHPGPKLDGAAVPARLPAGRAATAGGPACDPPDAVGEEDGCASAPAFDRLSASFCPPYGRPSSAGTCPASGAAGGVSALRRLLPSYRSAYIRRAMVGWSGFCPETWTTGQHEAWTKWSWKHP